jgi:hypothetical protein
VKTVVELTTVFFSKQMNSLIKAGVVEEYVPLCDIKGSYSAQFEHVSSLRIQRACHFLAQLTTKPPDHLAASHAQGGAQPRP